tara:strand:+ start:1840 stop:2358 length:519 start_codon:yes stop_codon:yes gene_type:complete
MIKLLIVLSLMLIIPLSANAQIVGDGTDNVTVHDYPFDITMLEGGSFTLYNYNGTGSISIVSPGWFEEHEALENNTVTVRLLPETISGTYIVNDVNDDTIISTVTVVEPFIPEPVEVVYETATIDIPAGGSPQQIAESIEVITQSQPVDKEVLDLRLRILQVLENIFRIVLG